MTNPYFEGEHDATDYGTVALWTLAMSMRREAGMTGIPSSMEEDAWMALAQRAVHLTTIFQKAPSLDH